MASSPQAATVDVATQTTRHEPAPRPPALAPAQPKTPRSVATTNSSPHADPIPPLEVLLPRLWQRVAQAPPQAPQPYQPDTSAMCLRLFSVELDGVVYDLVRVAPKPPPAAQPIGLSPREAEVVRLVAKGLPNKAIAAVLDISPWTVASHLRRVYAKLGASCRAEMVACVLQEGLLDGLL